MRSRIPDRLCAEAVELARAAAEEAAGPGGVGEHLGAVADGDRVVTHSFACKEPAYRGWRWAVTLARASRSRYVTVDELVLLPGPDAVLAPEWVPWSERLRPGDLGPGDLLPTEADDLRLEPGWTGADQPPPNSVEARLEQPYAEEAGVQDAAVQEAVIQDVVAPTVGSIAAVAEEIGMDRARVLSRYGLTTAAERWEDSFGPRTAMAQAAPAHCATCGFLVPVAGSLRQAFGLCANEYSPADGHVVSLGFGCGAHSEAAVMPRPPQPAEPVLDELRDVESVTLHPERAEDDAEEPAQAEVPGRP
ncbi:hypothetical protein AQ490_17780 [Wenjunlia vitaminophila]|uniref:DUF3027 domain-containing protein n=1 Tax=Wenjunlia vitaminophila TaxID=76728 RepID=A0A0T6LVI7_WENVI|nr:DUF3027 domain-containing protein [Wenjunlia vitaminophila]KRV50068.1 hypothetical protein AQ490_17780 [Wenjunlia vitaminophila]